MGIWGVGVREYALVADSAGKLVLFGVEHRVGVVDGRLPLFDAAGLSFPYWLHMLCLRVGERTTSASTLCLRGREVTVAVSQLNALPYSLVEAIR